MDGGYHQLSFADMLSGKNDKPYVQKITRGDAKPFIMGIHYARRMPSITHAFGLFEGGVLIGVVTYGIPASPAPCKGIAGEKNRKNVYELNRLVMLPEYNGKNYASILVGRSLKMMPHRSFIISYADSGWGHVGYIYQATNWLYTGKTVARTDIFCGDGKHGRHCEGKDRNQRMTRSSKYRYVYLVGDRRERREMRSELKWPVINEYPKGESHHYDVDNPQMFEPVMFYTRSES